MLIQIHMLQNYAPSNLNRDDTGSPKDAMFGGYRRGRISSQALKRSVRLSETFATAFGEGGLLGIRTKALPDLLRGPLKALGASDAELAAILTRVPEIGRESKKEPRGGKKADQAAEEKDGASGEQSLEDETKQLIFLAQNELDPLADKLLAICREMGPEKWPKAKMPEIADQLSATLPRSVDIALFGRMTTSKAFEDMEAAAQVAHAISTNALVQEFDYYTAVDDLSGESGAGMIGDIEFNSCTFYKYLNVHWETLVENLGGDREVACDAVKALVEAAALAQPSGKQNTFAAFNLPDLVLVEVSQRNEPASYANAFLKPLRARGDASAMEQSVSALAAYVSRVDKVYALQRQRAFVATGECELAGARDAESLPALKEWLAGQLGG